VSFFTGLWWYPSLAASLAVTATALALRIVRIVTFTVIVIAATVNEIRTTVPPAVTSTTSVLHDTLDL
jgi:hypothetical protein